MAEQFKWVSFYMELATKLLEFKQNRDLLIEKVKNAYSNIGFKLPKLDDSDDLKDIDPFTVFGLFNKGITEANRISILNGISSEFGIEADVPDDFSGIPILNNLMATFYGFSGDKRRKEDDIDNLWNVLEAALSLSETDSKYNRDQFATAYDKARLQFGIRWNLSMALFWVRPYTFINLDSRNRKYLSNPDNISASVVADMKAMKDVPTADQYLSLIDKCKAAINTGYYECSSFPELSHKAYLADTEVADGWWPSLDEYDPGITAQEYRNLFLDESVVKRTWLQAINEMYAMPNHLGTCKQMGERYGYAPSHYISFLTTAAANIAKKTDCPLLPREQKNSRYWPVLFQGKDPSDKSEGSYCWKMRKPVVEAIEMLIEEGILDNPQENKEIKEMIRFDHNTVLYGPPGTGKTYNSVIYAVAICEGQSVEKVMKEPYSEVLLRYKELKEAGRIAFTTFHQSYGYEEFIEGIKPILEEESGMLGYTIEDGVFKEFCRRAKPINIQTYGAVKIKEHPRIWVMLLGGPGMTSLKEECFSKGEVRIGWTEYEDLEWENDESLSWRSKQMLHAFTYEMEPGDIVFIEHDSQSIDAIGVIAGDYEYDKSLEHYPRKRKVEWIATNIDENMVQYLPGGRKQLARFTIYAADYIGTDVLSEILNKYIGYDQVISEDKKEIPYVFIIDEINRGNISKIFGELITLIEDTKRAGASEAMEAILPYSGETFSVPSNVYILGTMNTADRSIALMDTALRRRFEFVEMMPNPAVLESLGVGTIVVDGEELNVARMLNVINERIEFLFDREHTIGHAFFTKLADDPSLETLAGIFEKNVIPLLQEYFYEDYEKIQLVLGDNTKDDEFKFVLDKPLRIKDVFNGNPDIDLPEKGYIVQHKAFLKLESYKQIGRDL